MIKEVIDKNQIIPIWQEAFGDSEQDIAFFTENVKNAKCFGYYVGDNLASMIYFVPCTLNGKDAYYIYAACTKVEFKANGYMTKIIDYCKQNYDLFCLIPANEGLIDFYKKRGLDSKEDLSNLNFNQTDEICQYLLEGCTLSSPYLLVFRR